MSDDLKALKALLQDTPAPDAEKKHENIALAEKNFADLQGSRDGARPTSETKPKRGWLNTGVRALLNSLTTRGALAATTSVATLGLVVFVLLPQGGSEGFLPKKAKAPEDVSTAIATEEMAAESEPTLQYLEAPKEGQLEILEQVQPAPRASVAADRMMATGGANGQIRPVHPIANFEDHNISRPMPEFDADGETYANEAPNPLKVTREEPVSTFSIDVDTASYSIIRSSLTNGYLPDPEAVRIEEMINYFPYNYPAPAGDVPFQQTVTMIETPWNPDTSLVHIGIQGEMPVIDNRPPLNLVFLVDTSGSMNQPDKLPLLKQSFRLMLGQLRPEDQVAIVAYAGSAGEVLAPTAASESSKILAALDQLESGGGTAGEAGLEQAYAIAETMQKDGEVSRVLLATDGDFNVGISDPDALESFIKTKRDSGTYLSVLGFGRGNLNDATMQALAQHGNGQAAYIDTLAEAQKSLVDQLTGALYPIANDVKIQVEFNPATVAEYRLIGYETRILNREDFNNDKVDAGDIGAGHSVTAIYEITPVGSPAVKVETLRYSDESAAEFVPSDEMGFLKLRFKRPGETTSELLETPINRNEVNGNDDVRFSAAIAGFGQLLRDDTYLSDWGWDEAIALANGAKGQDEFGYRAEAVTLMRLAKSLQGK
ncbi:MULTISPECIES: vWA domain-containing protein [Halocynthiibacter]|uniref:VWA domain-containing protein n=1 Tax=Halocynthiibacter halioticoli TaxID=2986804 RepID=A0AAE3IWR5_9RHOB|nr:MULTISPECIES: VWA domain-containing protein [Halocynthiibacter]MCV6823404.1 VWA domain-containing protein [Halocynthiibacter halioticoli]MCW4056405.1 VWA domain-containing protein [Halocynthiibacter sp. SDUM655004]